MIHKYAYDYPFLVPVMTGFVIQCLKFVLYSVLDRRVNVVRFIQPDGMPNLHAAVFSSLCASIGLKYGTASIHFSFITAYSVIIVHDTLRLKGEKIKQGNTLNEIIDRLGLGLDRDGSMSPTIRVLQYRPLDVVAGVLLGILIAVILL